MVLHYIIKWFVIILTITLTEHYPALHKLYNTIPNLNCYISYWTFTHILHLILNFTSFSYINFPSGRYLSGTFYTAQKTLWKFHPDSVMTVCRTSWSMCYQQLPILTSLGKSFSSRCFECLSTNHPRKLFLLLMFWMFKYIPVETEVIHRNLDKLFQMKWK